MTKNVATSNPTIWKSYKLALIFRLNCVFTLQKDIVWYGVLAINVEIRDIKYSSLYIQVKSNAACIWCDVFRSLLLSPYFQMCNDLYVRIVSLWMLSDGIVLNFELLMCYIESTQCFDCTSSQISLYHLNLYVTDWKYSHYFQKFQPSQPVLINPKFI